MDKIFFTHIYLSFPLYFLPAHIHECTCLKARTNARACTRFHIHTHPHTRTHSCTHARMHPLPHTNSHTDTHTNTHTYTHPRACEVVSHCTMHTSLQIYAECFSSLLHGYNYNVCPFVKVEQKEFGTGTRTFLLGHYDGWRRCVEKKAKKKEGRKGKKLGHYDGWRRCVLKISKKEREEKKGKNRIRQVQFDS